VSFESPWYLLALLLIPLAVAAYVAAQRRRMRYSTTFTNLDVLAAVVPRSSWLRRHLPAALVLLAAAALTFAIARPHTSVAVPREQATIMLVTDASASMDAVDVKPSRLSAAKDAARRFTSRVAAEIKLGLITFDEGAELVAPPSREREDVRNGIDATTSGAGTATGNALSTALETIRRDGAGGRGRPPAAIVLLSDGKTTVGRDPVEVAREAKRRGIPVNTVALGTDEGVVQIGANTLAVPPDREAMKEVARVSGGRYFDAPDQNQLRSIYERLGSRLGSETEQREVTAAFAGGGLLLLLAGGLLSLKWSGRLP
jgi:Ca-activated chloride channel family protein